MLAIACGGTAGQSAPTGPAGGSGGAGDGSGGAEAGGSGNDPSAEEQLIERLSPVLLPLTTPPFGTCAAVAVVHGSVEVTVFGGTLWDDGPASEEETPFNVASVSKLVTAARVVSLAHGGGLELDDTFETRLPGVELVDANGGLVGDVVTVRHLLSHQSGVPKSPPDLEQKVNGDWTAPDLLSQLTEQWQIALTSPVGQYQYSNLGYALLGAMVERAELCSFAVCMKPYLSDLGMTGASFWPTDLVVEGAHGRVMQNGAPVFHSPAWYGSRYALPFTGLWTSMPSLARFGALLGASARDPGSELHSMSEGSGHGLGPVHGVRLGAPSLEHDGSGPGFHAALVVIPELDIAVAVATNGGNETGDEATAFASVVESVVLAVPPAP